MDTLIQNWPNLIFAVILLSPILAAVLFFMLMSKRKRIREICFARQDVPVELENPNDCLKRQEYDKSSESLLVFIGITSMRVVWVSATSCALCLGAYSKIVCRNGQRSKSADFFTKRLPVH